MFHIIWDNPPTIAELHHFSRWAHCTTNQLHLPKKNMFQGGFVRFQPTPFGHKSWEFDPGCLDCAAGSALFDRWHHPDAGTSVLHARSQAGAGVQAGLSATSWGKRRRCRSRCLRNLCTYSCRVQFAVLPDMVIQLYTCSQCNDDLIILIDRSRMTMLYLKEMVLVPLNPLVNHHIPS